MSDSDNLLDNLVSSLDKWSAHQASRQNSAEKNNKSSDNWWSKTKTTSEMEFEAQLKAIVESAVAGALGRKEDTDGYQKEAEAEVDDYEDELVNYDHVHFLATNPCYRT